MTQLLRTEVRRAVGANIKGTPAMSAAKVLSDMKVLKGKASVILTQEFKWGWYWRVLGTLLFGRGETSSNRWATSPSYKIGRRQPVSGAQAAIWSKRLWKKVDTRKQMLMKGHAGISEHRYVRAVLLEDILTGLRCWFVTTHFVVGGDERGDGPIRKELLANNIRILSRFMSGLSESGYPIMCELDANIHKDAAFYDDWMRMLNSHDAKVHGVHGVEYLFTVPGKRCEVKVLKTWSVFPKAHGGPLNTDHESRGCDFVLQEIA